jgi:peptide/nickel transport system substrate-binding protein
LRNKTWRAIGATAVLLGIVIVAWAQTGTGEPSSIELSPPVDTKPSLPPSTVSAPFEYRVGLLAGLSTTNYWEYIGEKPTVWNTYVLGPTKPALYGIDPVSNGLVPDLALTSAEPARRGGVWTVEVKLSEDVSWSDGQPVTAADVVYTFETVRRLGLSGGWDDAYPSEIGDIEAEGEHRLTIRFSERPSLRTWPYGLGLAPIMPSHVWAPISDPLSISDSLYRNEAKGDVSGGPLQVAVVGESRIESAANPGHPQSSPDRVSYLIYPDEASATAALQDGAIDAIITPNGLSADGVERLAAEPGVSIENSPANSVRYLGFNLGREPMSAPSFRKAVALLLDREAATESLVPEASAAYTMLSAANKTWFLDEAATEIAGLYSGALTERLNEAINGLEESGYAWDIPPSLAGDVLVPGTGLTVGGLPPAPVTILTPGDEYDPARSDYSRRIESTLDLLGFDARPVITDFDTVVDLAFTASDGGERQYDMYVLGWTLGNPALPDYYRWLFASDGSANSTGYSSAEFDATLARYEQATDAEAAMTELWSMERTLAGDLPYLVLYHPEIVEAYRSDRVRFGTHSVLGGIQGRLGGIDDLTPASPPSN